MLAGKDKAAIFLLGYNSNTSLLVVGELMTIVNLGFTLVFCYKPAKDGYFDLFWPDKSPDSFSFLHKFMVIFIMGILTVVFTIISGSL